MTDIRIIQGGKPSHEAAEDLVNRIKALIYEQDGMLLTTAIGALEIAKIEIWQEFYNDE